MRSLIDIQQLSVEEIDALIALANDIIAHPDDVARLLKFRDNPSDESWIGGNA